MCLTPYYTQKDTEKNLLVVRMGKSVIQRAANKCQIKEKLIMILLIIGKNKKKNSVFTFRENITKRGKYLQ